MLTTARSTRLGLAAAAAAAAAAAVLAGSANAQMDGLTNNPGDEKIVINRHDGEHAHKIVITQDDVWVEIDGNKVPQDRLVREDDRLIVLDDQGDEMASYDMRGVASPGRGVARGWDIDLGPAMRRALPVMLGITMGEVGPGMAAQLGIQPGAVLLESVVDGLPADRAGLRRYDVIVALDDRPVDGIQTVTDVLREKRPGQTLAIEVVRNGQRRVLDVELDAFDPNRLGRFGFGSRALEHNEEEDLEWSGDLEREFEERFGDTRRWGQIGRDLRRAALAEIRDILQNQGLPVTDRLMRQLDEPLQMIEERLRDAFEEETDRFRGWMLDEDRLFQAPESWTDRFQFFGDEVERHWDHMKNEWGELQDRLYEEFGERGEQLEEFFGERTEEIEDAFGGVKDALEEGHERVETLEELVEELEERIDHLEERLNELGDFDTDRE